MFTALIIVALLLGSSVMVTTFSSPASNSSDRDRLKAAAEKIMTQILLDPGYPYEWVTSNTSYQNLQAFGLARYGSTARQAYELDPDKVLRLNSTLQGSNTCYVPPSRAAYLLGLGYDYGFTLEFNQTLQILATQIGGTDKYRISVMSEYSLPVIDANVFAVLYSVTGSNIALTGPRTNRTSYDGTCIMDFGGSYGSSRALAVAVNYYGIQGTFIFGEGSTISASLLDCNLILRNAVSSPSESREVLVVQGSNGTEFRDYNVGLTLNPPTPNFLLNNPPEPSAIGVVAVSQGKLIIAQRDFSKISYRTIPAIRSASMSYSLDRNVLVGGSTLLVTLYLWRMAN